MSSHRVPPPGVTSSISRGSFRDTRVANDFSPFGVDDFNSANPATKQMAPAGSPFLHGVRPGSLHTNGTPMHRRSGAPALSRRDSMDSFYAEAPMHGRARPPHPDDVFSDHGSQSEYYEQATPYGAHNRLGAGHGSQIGMSVHGATPQGQHGHLQPDDNSVRYGSLYGEPYESKRQPLHDVAHKQSFQTNGSKLSRSTKLTKKSGLSGFSLRRKPKQPAMDEESSQFNGTPYLGHGHHTASIISERGNVHQTPKPSRSPSIMSQHQEILHTGKVNRSQSLLSARPNMLKPESIQVHESPGSVHRRGSSFAHEPATRPISMRESIRSIHKAPPGTFPFERDGEDIVAQVWLPWTEKLQERPCHFHVDGMHGERYWLEVDYRWTKAINGTAKFHGEIGRAHV